MPTSPRARQTLRAVLAAAALSVAGRPAPAAADGILQSIASSQEITYSLLSTKTTDPSGTTTKTESESYGSRSHLRVNYDLLPKLNLNAGGTFEKTFSELTSDLAALETELTRVRPYAWLTLRDPVGSAAVGYDLADDSVKTSGQPDSALTRQTYSAQLSWRPPDLPWTQARYARSTTRDDPLALVNIEDDQLFLKSEYSYRGLNAHYAGTYLDTRDKIREIDTRQISHEGKLSYATTVLDGRVSLSTDNRLRLSELTTETGGRFTGPGGAAADLVTPVAGLSALDDTPLSDALGPNSALIDGDTTTGAGVNLGFPGPGGDFRRRNLGLDLGAAVAVSRLRVWVDGWGPGILPADITGWFSWDIYTSADNLTWSLHATVAPAIFGPFDRRFEINFPTATARYIKAVTRPLPGGIVGSTDSSLYPNIIIAEVQAFVDRTVPGAGQQRVIRTETLVRTHNVDIRAVLFRSPSLYYRFNGDYQEIDPDAETRYSMSNGLFFTHRFHPIVSASANASWELGKERDETRTGFRYYGSVATTPLKTLTNSLVYSGNREWAGETTTTNNSLVLHNTAQLYRGLDATLNLGAQLTSSRQGDGASSSRRELYVNLGTGISPHPSLTLTSYYLGKLSHTSADGAEGASDTTENRWDLGLSFTPFPTLFLSATVNIGSATGEETTVVQNYGVSWSPFRDGTLQLSLYYAENHLAEDASSRIIQPTVRWYLSTRRRTYLEASYQLNTSEASAFRTESRLFSARLNVYY